VAVSPDGSRVYVAVATYGVNGKVYVVDAATNTAITTITTGYNGGNDIAVAPGGRYVYVADRGPGGAGGLTVIDTTNNAASYIGTGGSPYGVAVSPDGSRLYTDNGSYVRVIDAATRKSISIFDGPYNPFAKAIKVAVSPDGSRLYLWFKGESGVSVIDTATNKTITTVGVATTDVAVSPDGHYVYATWKINKTLAVIDAATNTVTKLIAVGDATGVAVSPDGRYVYVANQADGTMSVVFTGN
jgi:YVTN family beta-propeller protein